MRDSGKERGILVEGGEKGAGQPHLLPRLQVRPRLQVPRVQQVAPGSHYVQQHVLHIKEILQRAHVGNVLWIRIHMRSDPKPFVPVEPGFVRVFPDGYRTEFNIFSMTIKLKVIDSSLIR